MDALALLKAAMIEDVFSNITVNGKTLYYSMQDYKWKIMNGVGIVLEEIPFMDTNSFETAITKLIGDKT